MERAGPGRVLTTRAMWRWCRGPVGGPMPGRSWSLALAVSVALPGANSAGTQPPLLQPGDTLRFIGAEPFSATSGPCDAIVADCAIDTGDLGNEEVRVFVGSALLAGGLGVEVRATGRLLGRFNIAGENGHRIG